MHMLVLDQGGPLVDGFDRIRVGSSDGDYRRHADTATKRILVTMWEGTPTGRWRGCAQQNTGLVTWLSRRCGLIASAHSPFSTPTVQK